MWLLNTTTLELRYFNSPDTIRYAILSHVWQEEDHTLTFHDIKAIHTRCTDKGEDPRALVQEKVRRFCTLAAEEGYEWAWLDTCCIDKTSSAELSEGINSMYSWYEHSTVCYAYLFDVRDDDDPFARTSAFRRSMWHKRGWTLQELIAPSSVVFLSASWHSIGTKSALVRLLSEITGVASDVLLWGGSSPGRSWRTRVSVAQRMSWASGRVTTRKEDRAYSLMGIFGVTMPVIYGEGGEQAFYRLQREIINICPDQSIFAWGPIHPNVEGAWCGILELEHFNPAPHEGISWGDMETWDRLLAPSPDQFADSAEIRPLTQSEYTEVFGVALDLSCTVFANGTTLHLPISSGFMPTAHPSMFVHLAALACTKTTAEAVILLLFLTRSEEISINLSTGDLAEVIFSNIGRPVIDVSDGTLSYYRGAILRQSRFDWANRSSWSSHSRRPQVHWPLSQLHRRPVRIEAPTHRLVIPVSLLAPTSPGRESPDMRPGLAASSSPLVFEIPYWVSRRLEDLYGFVYQGSVPGPPTITFEYRGGSRRFTLHRTPGTSERDHRPALTFTFINASRNETVQISFGVGCECKVEKIITGRTDSDIDEWWIKVYLFPVTPDPESQDQDDPPTQSQLVRSGPINTPSGVWRDQECYHHLASEQQDHEYEVASTGGGGTRRVYVRTLFDHLEVDQHLGGNTLIPRVTVALDLVTDTSATHEKR